MRNVQDKIRMNATEAVEGFAYVVMVKFLHVRSRFVPEA